MKFLSLVLGVFFFAAAGVIAQTTNSLSNAEIKGQQLAQELLQENPTENSKQSGILRVQYEKGKTAITPIKFITFVTNEMETPTNGSWETDYFAEQTNNTIDRSSQLIIVHQGGCPNKYFLCQHTYGIDAPPLSDIRAVRSLGETQIMSPFAGSDFWIADLGLEFFHWPDQKILKHETRRTRACAVLQSTNPNPAPGAYSRVVTWIDDESHAIIWAEAYDANNKLLKEFDPKKVKKVNGHWELEEMDIRNVQTHSRTWITFDLSGKN